MTGALRVELTERLEVVERHRGLPEDLVVGIDGAHAREVEQRPEQRRRVAFGEHEAVAVRPDRVLRVEAHEPLPQGVRDRGDAHRRARVARVRLLDRVHAKSADRVDGQRVQVGGHGRLLSTGRPTMPHEGRVGLGRAAARRRALRGLGDVRAEDDEHLRPLDVRDRWWGRHRLHRGRRRAERRRYSLGFGLIALGVVHGRRLRPGSVNFRRPRRSRAG